MLKGKKVILRTIRESDLDEFFSLDTDISERGEYDAYFIHSEPRFKSDFRETGFWKEDFGTMLVTSIDGRTLGIISYFKGLKYAEGFEIGYKIFKREDRGKGYMTEALKLFTSFMFANRPIARMSVNMLTENIASRKLAEKCGYKHEGIMRKAVFCRGRYYDLNLMSILREECTPLPELLESLNQ
ncbi:MAG: GNAT family N-acetyltransferase [Bacillota bacterium]